MSPRAVASELLAAITKLEAVTRQFDRLIDGAKPGEPPLDPLLGAKEDCRRAILGVAAIRQQLASTTPDED